MRLAKLTDKLVGVKNKATGAGNATARMISGWLDDFNKAAKILSTFGFRVGKFKVGSGLTPKIATSIVGSLEKIEKDEIKKLMDANKKRKIVVAILKAVVTAKNIQERVDVLPTLDVRIDVVLGWPPDISIDFLTDEQPQPQPQLPVAA
jgi:hypothetical protein